MLLIFLLALSLFLRLFFLRRARLLGREIAAAAQELIQQREGSSLAVDFIVVVVLTIVPLTKHAAHFIAEQIQILFGNSHLFDRLVNLRDTQAAGTFQAVAFVQCHAIFNLGNKHNSNVFSALAAHFRLHMIHSFSQGFFPLTCSIAYQAGKRKNKL